MKKDVMIIISTILILFFVIVLVFNNKNDIVGENNSGNNIDTNNSINDEKVEDLVENAEFEKSTEEKYLNEDNQKRYSLKDIVLPKYKFESFGSQLANGEIENLYKKLEKEFVEELNGDKNTFIESYYDVMKAKGMLSTLITVKRTTNGVETETYYPYVFDLTTKDLLTTAQMMKKIVMTVDKFNEKFPKAVRETELFKEIVEKNLLNEEEQNKYVTDIFNECVQKIEGRFSFSYIDALGRLNVIMELKVPNTEEVRLEIIKVK